MDFFKEIGRPEETRINQCLHKIASDLARPRRHVGFLFGAGMSVAAGLPAGRHLGSALLKIIFPPPDELSAHTADKILNEYPLEAIASAVAAYPGVKREQLKQCLTELYLDPIGKENLCLDSHELFAQLVGLNYVTHIFTTNLIC